MALEVVGKDHFFNFSLKKTEEFMLIIVNLNEPIMIEYLLVKERIKF